MGYHRRQINKGTLGTPSKIQEELEELEDALDQGNHILALCEMADIYGALEALCITMQVSMADLAKMAAATKSAFESGERK